MFIDTVGPPASYRMKLEERFKHVVPQIEFTVEPKADSSYPIVSAASIAAKVTRDRWIDNWKPQQQLLSDMPTGSGYPGDPETKKWIRANVQPFFGYPDLVRFSWETCKTILAESATKIEW